MLPAWWVALLVVLALGVLIFQGVSLYLARRMPRLDPGTVPGPPRRPTVSVVIAARNEEDAIGTCLDSLLAQSYGDLEIVVVDGGSTDRTREIVASKGSRVRLLREPPLPPGWVGKNWACQVGADASTGALILFTDADVRHHPDSVRSVVAWALEQGSDLTTFAPRIEVVGFWERVVLPFYVQVVLTYFRAPRINVDSSRSAMANGQFCLVSRAAYAAVGGHAAVRGYVLEDVRLAQLFRKKGYRLRIAWTPELIATRMYRDRREMREGLLKNIHGTEFSAARQVGFLAGLVGLFLLPLGLLPYGVWTGDVVLIAVGGFLWIALFGKHVGFARAIQLPPAYGLLYPVAVAFYIDVVSTSLARGLRHEPLSWKGRTYALDAEAGAGPTSNR